jgi:hypothetical protein
MAILGVNGPTSIEKTDIVEMKNYSKTQIRMTPSTGSASVKAGDTTVFRLPSAKVVDLATLRFNFVGETNGDATHLLGFPKYMSSLIHQMEIWCNGQSIMNITRYNQIYNILRDYSSDYEKYQNKLFNNADPSVDYVSDANGDITKYCTNNETNNVNVNQFKKCYVIDDFIGFLDFSKGDRQSFLNTNLVGDFEIHITWATDKVLWEGSGDYSAYAAPFYTITNLIGWIDAIEFKDDKFTTAQTERINSGDLIRMPFKNYKSYTGDNTGNNAETTIRVVENTNSLDKLIFTYLHKDRNISSELQLEAGVGENRIDNSSTATLAQICEGDIPARRYHYEHIKSLGGIVLTNTSKHFTRNGQGLGYNTDRTKSALVQFELDSQDLHNPMDLASCYEETLKAFDLTYNNVNKANPGLKNLEGWCKYFYACAYSLNHNVNPKDPYVISGIDTGATAINVAVKVTNSQRSSANYVATPMLITEMTSELLIGNGRTVALRP